MFGDILPIPKQYTQELKNLIDMLLKKDANLRPSISEILSIDFVIEKMIEYGYTDESTISPVNKQEAEINFNLLNVKFENLLDDKEKDNNGNNNTNNSNNSSNNKGFNNKLSENNVKQRIKFESNLFKGSNSTTSSTKTKNILGSVRNININSKTKDNKIEIIEHEMYSNEHGDNTLCKNQYSVPDLLSKPNIVETESPEKLSMEESKCLIIV
jgi:serine/threonine protein kinase